MRFCRSTGPLASWTLPLLLAAGCGTTKINFDDTGPGGRTDTDDSGLVDGAVAVDRGELDYGIVFLGADATREVVVTNVGDAAIDLAGTLDSPDFVIEAVAIVQPGESLVVSVTWTPSAIGAVSGTLTLADALSDDAVDIALVGQAQEDADGDGHGSLASGGDDCDDANPTAYPGAAEIWYDGVDQDCLGGDDYDRDADGADYTVDCDEDDPNVHPGATETWYDGTDADCLGDDDYDQDKDGHVVGVDCDDTDATAHPGAVEIWYDGVDQDCDGRDDDRDGDGHRVATDCNDLDASVHPGATEIWYDGVDQDCAGDDDYDQDGDGVTVGTDCVDTDPTVTGPVPETLDGIDSDCDGVIDDLPVTDVASGVLYGSSNLGIGNARGLSLGGDLTGDGADDIVVATDASGAGYAWVIRGFTAATASGTITAYDTAQITGQSSSYPLGRVARPADVTGDGQADLLVSGSLNDGYNNYGRAWAITGGSSLSGSTTISSSSNYRARFYGDEDSDLLGWIAAGDVDGDGIADVVTGAPLDNYSSRYDSGNVAVFGGTVSGSYDLTDADDQIHGSESYEYLGTSLLVTDINDDGYADILAGASGSDEGGTDAGAVYLFHGNASLSWSSVAEDAARTRVIGGSSRGYLGSVPLATPGDVDRDGFVDLVLASSYEGKVWIFWNAAALAGDVDAGDDADLTLSGSSSSFGASVAYASDLDGDGATEVYVGDSSNDTAASNAGAVWQFKPTSGSSGTWTSSNASAVFYGASSGDALGNGLAAGGDADGDGQDDLLVGATGSDGGGSNGGAVYVILGW